MAVEKVAFDLPKMYADHHVEAVRAALLQLEGVEEVLASSAAKHVAVHYDDKKVKAAAISDTLAKAGYAPGEEPTLPKLPEGKEDTSPWFQAIHRITGTNMLDLEMSGDFRKY